MPIWLKRVLQVFTALILLIIVVFIGLGIYVSSHKKELLVSVTKELNKSLNGTLTVGGMEPSFLKGFPGVSVKLSDVELKDSLWNTHKHTFLNTKDLSVSVNALALLKGTVEIRRIYINDAEIYLYTDSTGYSNTSIFKSTKDTTRTKEDKSSPAEIRRFDLNNVRFILDNRKGNKLFLFAVDEFSGKVDYPFSGWKADIKLKTLVRSLAFNTKRGSFIKDKVLEGKMDISYSNSTGILTVEPNKLNIGKDPFVIGAKFNIKSDPVDFAINIEANGILWRNASALLAPNITAKLNMFNLEKPINVKCIISGNMGAGDPSILVNASVKDNKLTSPGGAVEDCNFAGVFTNNFINGKGFTDANSAIKLYRFSGKYKDMPFTIDTAFIHNLDKPIATGTFRSKFEVTKLNPVVGEDILKFTKGSADLALHYSADIVDFKLVKPVVTGLVSVKNADVSYVPRNVNFKNTSITLDFKGNDLFIRDIRLQTGKSIINMDGSIANFMNLYYNAPEKTLLKWKMYSPQIHLGEFMGFLGSRKGRKPVAKAKKNSNFKDQMNEMLEKGKAEIEMKVDQVHYGKFIGTGMNANVFLSETGLELKNVTMKHGGGAIRLNGSLTQQGSGNKFKLNSVVDNVNIRSFFYAFDNFGLKSPTYKNLKGNFFTKVNLSGNISNQGKMLPGSMNGDIQFDLKRGALLNYDAVKSVGKFAFPFRDLDNITFDNLHGNFLVRGNLITIKPMQINSSILNVDLEGVYSMGKGTNIYLDVPLRNPKKDDGIQDKKEIKERRMKGIVVHILATDGDDGNIKFKLIRKKDKNG
ncbi:AsmA family protein [Pedobacter antarcticus]|uniref:AsmA family protein n=1 Tax=Pedobacter antarcticus TaxID=34086 RepID=UPI000891051B|nr:AsmA-like C-terminal region-containing protein [Pedobacter antarcticus]SDM85801.1 AsmA family protein [Pedobacter antarcticus]